MQIKGRIGSRNRNSLWGEIEWATKYVAKTNLLHLRKARVGVVVGGGTAKFSKKGKRDSPAIAGKPCEKYQWKGCVP